MSVECSYCGSYREPRKRCDSCGAYEVTEADRQPAVQIEFLGGYAAYRPQGYARLQHELLARQQGDLNSAAALQAQQEYAAAAQQQACIPVSGPGNLFGLFGSGLGALWP